MPRTRLIRTAEFPYHVTSRTRNKDWYDIPLNQAWELSKSSLNKANSKYPITLHAFVLMSNHYHMLLSTPDENIDSFMAVFNKTFSERIAHESKRENQIFGGRYKWSLINEKNYLFNTYRYIYQNPIRACMSFRCENYSFSTLHYLYNKKAFSIPLHPLEETNSPSFLEWTNQNPSAKENKSIQLGLRKKFFTPAKDRELRTPFQLSKFQ